jgi:hypothetical protein
VTRRARRGRLKAVAVVGAASMVFVGGCGDDEEDSQDTAAAPAQVEIATPANPDEPLTAPASVEAGEAEITFTNSGEKPANAQLIRVEGDHSGEETLNGLRAVSSGKPAPPWFFAGGGIGTTVPGETRTVTQVFEPGTYYAINDETGKPAVPDPIEVTGEAAEASVPEAPATITASEYTFEAQELASGSGELTFENAGEEPHHVVAMPLAQGGTIQEAERFFQSEEEPQGPPPVDFRKEVSTAVVEGGDTQVVELPLVKGDYALVCFISDRQGGPPHIAKGMIAEATVE